MLDYTFLNSFCSSEMTQSLTNDVVLDCPTGMLIDFNLSNNSWNKGDFSMSEILQLSDIADTHNLSGLIETIRHNSNSDSTQNNSSFKLSDTENPELFPEGMRVSYLI